MTYRMLLKHTSKQEACLCSHLKEIKGWAEEYATGYVDFSEVFQDGRDFYVTFEYDIDRIAFILQWM